MQIIMADLLDPLDHLVRTSAFHSDTYRTCGKAQPPLVGRAGIEPPPTAPKARPLKDWAIWTLVISHRYRWAMDILTHPRP